MNQNALPKYYSREWPLVTTCASHFLQSGRASILVVWLLGCCFTVQAQSNYGAHDRGSQNTLIGTQTDVLAAGPATLHHATAIGYGAVVSVSDAVVLGNQANVGIGTSAPTARLHIRSEQAGESGLRLENLTAQSPAVAQTDKFLSVDGAGGAGAVPAAIRSSC